MSSRVYIYLFLSIALVVRLIAIYLFPDLFFPDDSAYAIAGQEFFNGGRIEIDNVMPLHPIYYHVANAVGSVKLFNIVVSTATVLVIYQLSMAVFENELISRVASLVWAVYPHAIFYSVTGLTETLYVFILLLAFLFFYRKQFVVASFFIVLSILHRPTLDLVAPIVVFVFSYYAHSLSKKESLKNVLVYFIVYVCLMTPWWIHQYAKYDQFVRLNLGDGIVLYVGNNELNKSGGGVNSDKGIDFDVSWLDSIEDPIEKNNALKARAFDYIANNKVQTLELSIVKFARFWRLWPYNSNYERPLYIAMSLLSYGVVLSLFFLYIVRSLKKQYKRVSPILVLIGYLTLVHMITIASIRYRFPLEPFLVLFASFSVSTYLSKMIRHE